MPSILLVNENKIVSRLLQLSCEKNGYNLEEVTSLDTSGDSYDVIFVDSDLYNNELLAQIESKLNYDQLGYIGTKQESSPDGFDLVIEKPFLPTDFVDMIKEKVIGKTSKNVVSENEDIDQEIEDFDLDEADLLMDDEKPELDSIDDDVDKLLAGDEELLEDIDDLDTLDDADLSLNSAAVMTTGIAASMAQANSDPEELADMVSEIDEMQEDDLVSLDEEEILQESVSDESDEEEILDESVVADIEDTLKESVVPLDEVVEENKEDLSSGLGVLAAGVSAVAAGAAASQISDNLDDTKKGVTAMDDIDNLSETDLQEALGESVSEVSEEIISEEIIPDGEETVVESNDVEQWIRDAVSKAITPSMIQEALDGMDIKVTLSLGTKKEDNTSS